MTVSKMSLICWIVFVVMSAAFLPLAIGIDRITALPAPARLPAAIAVVGLLWWGPFAYAMYLAMGVMLRGDKRLLRRGVRGSAVVLSARATSTVIGASGSTGGYSHGSRVHKYGLRVTVPGRRPYETTCSICVGGYTAGQEVEVAVSPRNHKRVTIVPGQVRAAVWPGFPGTTTFTSPSGAVGISIDLSGQPSRQSRAALIEELTQLGRLHSQGVLTDAEFAAQKARILDAIGDE